MFNWVKRLLGTAVAAPDLEAETVAPKAKPAAKPAAKKAAPKKAAPKKAAAKSAKHTKASLGKLTKVQIDELAKAELGVELDRRKTKDDMIKDFLKSQKK